MNVVYKAALALALIAITTASYGAVRAHHVFAGNFISNVLSGKYIQLNSTGATTISFNLPAAGKKVLTYNAECAAEGPADAWVDIDIIVNGSAVVPSTSIFDAFCMAGGDLYLPTGVRSSHTLVFQGKAGTNTVRILARGNNGVTEWSLGDSTLVIHD